MRWLAASLTCALLLACAGHSQNAASGAQNGGKATVEGAVAGVSIPSAFALAIPDNSSTDVPLPNAYARLTIAIANRAFSCQTPALASATYIAVVVNAIGANPVGPGTYVLNNDQQSPTDNLGSLVTTDAQCAETAPATVIAGHVTITATSAATISGTFVLSFDSGEAMQGSFDAAVCASMPASLKGGRCG